MKTGETDARVVVPPGLLRRWQTTTIAASVMLRDQGFSVTAAHLGRIAQEMTDAKNAPGHNGEFEVAIEQVQQLDDLHSRRAAINRLLVYGALVVAARAVQERKADGS